MSTTGRPPADLYETIHRRRDVRSQFSGAPVETAALRRVLEAAHAAPSVGMSQPWDFILIDDSGVKRSFVAHVAAERALFADTLDSAQAASFERIKSDGVLESSLSMAVTYDPARGSPAVIGRHAIADAGLYSVCLASRTCGWPPPPKAGESAGCRCTGNRS